MITARVAAWFIIGVPLGGLLGWALRRRSGRLVSHKAPLLPEQRRPP